MGRFTKITPAANEVRVEVLHGRYKILLWLGMGLGVLNLGGLVWMLLLR